MATRTVKVMTCDDCLQDVKPPSFLLKEWGAGWNGAKMVVTLPNEKCHGCARRFVKTMFECVERDSLRG